jgi:hypothetical protein
VLIAVPVITALVLVGISCDLPAPSRVISCDLV